MCSGRLCRYCGICDMEGITMGKVLLMLLLVGFVLFMAYLENLQ
jgi:hypothetical protein